MNPGALDCGWVRYGLPVMTHAHFLNIVEWMRRWHAAGGLEGWS